MTLGIFRLAVSKKFKGTIKITRYMNIYVIWNCGPKGGMKFATYCPGTYKIMLFTDVETKICIQTFEIIWIKYCVICIKSAKLKIIGSHVQHRSVLKKPLSLFSQFDEISLFGYITLFISLYILSSFSC